MEQIYVSEFETWTTINIVSKRNGIGTVKKYQIIFNPGYNSHYSMSPVLLWRHALKLDTKRNQNRITQVRDFSQP